MLLLSDDAPLEEQLQLPVEARSEIHDLVIQESDLVLECARDFLVRRPLHLHEQVLDHEREGEGVGGLVAARVVHPVALIRLLRLHRRDRHIDEVPVEVVHQDAKAIEVVPVVGVRLLHLGLEELDALPGVPQDGKLPLVHHGYVRPQLHELVRGRLRLQLPRLV